MYQEILINAEPQERRVAILENKNLEEFYVERQGGLSLVGNIYKGIVDSVVPAIGAAFVRIGLKKNGFLYIHDLTQPDFEKMAELIDKPNVYEGTVKDLRSAQGSAQIKDQLRPGQQILVQIVKEPLGGKGPRLTTHISLPGRLLVLLPCDNHLGISRRIQESKERMRLRELIKGLNLPRNLGLIVRTVAAGQTKREFVQDLNYLMHLWRKIKATGQKRAAPCLIHEEYDLLLRIVRDKFTAQTNKLLVDLPEEYKRIMRFLNIFSPRLKRQVELYRSDIPIFEKRAVEDEINRIYDRKVVLKSGGYIMIEPTEGLVAIDVNSARFTGRRDPEETAYLVNIEAAREIARQIRLRDIGGIIIIDFIDMKSAKHRKKVLDVLNEALRRDYARTEIQAISQLGIIEMTRQRTRKSLESVIYRSCPYCQGKGLVKSPASTAVLVLRRIKKLLRQINQGYILVFTHPEVAAYLLNENRPALYGIENRFKVKILIRQDASLHMENFKVEAN